MSRPSRFFTIISSIGKPAISSVCLYFVQPDGAALLVVHETARSGDYDLRLAFELLDLFFNGLTAIKADGADTLLKRTELSQFVPDLNG